MTNKTKYVDGYVLVVPKDKVEEYKKMASEAAKIWMKHGALAVRECMGDDLNPDMQGHEYTKFSEMTNTKEDETVWFSYIEYESKEQRDKVNAKVMEDPYMQPPEGESEDHMENMPFDMKRMAFGGFEVQVSE